MKKIFITIAFVFVYFINVYGQITYSKPVGKDYVNINNNISHNFYENDSVYAYTYVIRSDNQFERECIVLPLGKTKEEAISSLETMILLFNDANDGDKVKLDKRTFSVIKTSYCKVFFTTKMYCSGSYSIPIGNIKKDINAVKRYKPKESEDL